MFRKAVKGASRIHKVVERVKADIVELEKGVGEIDIEIDGNNEAVAVKKRELFLLESETKAENDILSAAKNMATSIKGNLEKLLGV